MPQSSYLAGPLCTQDSIVQDLRCLGVKKGDIVLLHSSLRAIGWVSGGPEAVVLALLDVLGQDGTLVVPTQTEHNSDPTSWKDNPAPVPEEWHDTIRATLPAFDSNRTPSRKMGAIAEMVRTWPGAYRSAHPQSSFAAIGLMAAELMADHAFDCLLGEQSPLAKLESANARVLLLGTSYMKCTSFHMGEYRSGSTPRGSSSMAAMTPSGRQWLTVEDVLVQGGKFDELGADFERAGRVVEGMVGGATSKLFSMADAISHATEWLPKHRLLV